MGDFFSGTDKTTTNTVNTVNLDPRADKAYGSLLNQLQGAFSGQFTPYTGDRFADFNQDQTAYFDMMRGIAGSPDQSFDQALGITQDIAEAGLRGIDPALIQQYMNPYIESVMDVQDARSLEEYQRQQRDLAARASQGIGFGGGRFGIEGANLADRHAQRQFEQNQQMLLGGWDRALGAAERGLDRAGMSAAQMGQLAKSGLGHQLAKASALGQIGAQQQELQQAMFDFDYNEFMRRINQPRQDALALSGAMTPLMGLTAGSTTNETVTQETTPSMAASIMGLGSMALGIPGVGAGLGALTGGALGSMGMSGLANFMGDGIGAAAMSVSNPYTNIWDAYQMGQSGQYGPYNKGGPVLKYQEGGVALTEEETAQVINDAEAAGIDWGKALELGIDIGTLASVIYTGGAMAGPALVRFGGKSVAKKAGPKALKGLEGVFTKPKAGIDVTKGSLSARPTGSEAFSAAAGRPVVQRGLAGVKGPMSKSFGKASAKDQKMWQSILSKIGMPKSQAGKGALATLGLTGLGALIDEDEQLPLAEQQEEAQKAAEEVVKAAQKEVGSKGPLQGRTMTYDDMIAKHRDAASKEDTANKQRALRAFGASLLQSGKDFLPSLGSASDRYDEALRESELHALTKESAIQGLAAQEFQKKLNERQMKLMERSQSFEESMAPLEMAKVQAQIMNASGYPTASDYLEAKYEPTNMFRQKLTMEDMKRDFATYGVPMPDATGSYDPGEFSGKEIG